MVLKMRLALAFALVLAASTCLAAPPGKPANKDAGTQLPKPAAGKDSDKETAEVRLAAIRRIVERKFRVKGHGDYYVVVVVTTSYHTNVKRAIPEGVFDPKGTVMTVLQDARKGTIIGHREYNQGRGTEFREDGKFYPIRTAEFRAIKGRDAAIQFVVDELAKPVGEGEVQTRFGKKTTGPPPTRDWKVIGRLVDAASADNAAGSARRAFEAEPQWEVAEGPR